MLCSDSVVGEGTTFIPSLVENVDRIRYLVNRPERWDMAGVSELFTGVDLGTSMVKVLVVDEAGCPRAAVMKEATVVKSGLILDYVGALSIVKEIIADIRAHLPVGIEKAATSYPPNTESANVDTTKYILEGADLRVVCVLDEPTAANEVLKLTNGAIVDIGGGTTGISVFRDGEVVYSNDEPTGGVHLSLVLAGHLGIGYEQAEQLKRDRTKAKDIFPIVRPVIEKISSIIGSFLRGFNWIEEIYLVGGTCELEGIAEIVSEELGILAKTPPFPQAITPYGIALSCL
ncbi:MAG: ethanolamine utilization protein EutJ [Deltaproteobacteria bacterium]|nr:ethanolamine utilization protein EutJ [Deltaproteobacteria bacterium]